MIGRGAEPSRIGQGLAGLGDLLVDPERRADALRSLLGESRGSEQPLGLGVFEADRDALDRRASVERQEGRAGEGDRELRDQEFGAARHPEADNVARTHAPRE